MAQDPQSLGYEEVSQNNAQVPPQRVTFNWSQDVSPVDVAAAAQEELPRGETKITHRLTGKTPHFKRGSPKKEEKAKRSPRKKRITVTGEESCMKDSFRYADITNIDVNADAYGAAILVLVRDWPILSRGQWWSAPARMKRAVYHFAFGVGVLSLNLFMQFSLLYFIGNLVVAKDVLHVQRVYKDALEAVYDADGNFQQDFWDEYDGREPLCNIGITNSWFYSVCIYCWTLNVLIEFRRTINFFTDIKKMPVCGMPEEQVLEPAQVVALTRRTKNMILCCVILPKVLISLCLLLEGCAWLSSAKSFDDLVLNSVAMVFIVEVDDLLGSALLPKSFRADVEELHLFVRDVGAAKEIEHRFNRSAFFAVCAGIFVCTYPKYLQTQIPQGIFALESACHEYLLSQFDEICKPSGIGANRFDHCAGHWPEKVAGFLEGS